MNTTGNIIEDLKLLIEICKGFIWILENDYEYDFEITKKFIQKLQHVYGI